MLTFTSFDVLLLVPCLPALWQDLRVYIFDPVRKVKLSLRLNFSTARQF